MNFYKILLWLAMTCWVDYEGSKNGIFVRQLVYSSPACEMAPQEILKAQESILIITHLGRTLSPYIGGGRIGEVNSLSFDLLIV